LYHVLCCFRNYDGTFNQRCLFLYPKLGSIVNFALNLQWTHCVTLCLCPAGVRMRYPSSFVLVTADTDNEIMHQQTSMTTVLPGSGTVPRKLSVTIGTPSSSPVDIELPCKLECGSSALQPLMEESGAVAVSKRIMEKVWEDCVCCSGQHSQQR